MVINAKETFNEKDLRLESEAIQSAQVLVNTESRKYLSEKDWYVVRFQETGVIMPEEISLKRIEARESII